VALCQSELLQFLDNIGISVLRDSDTYPFVARIHAIHVLRDSSALFVQLRLRDLLYESARPATLLLRRKTVVIFQRMRWLAR